MNESFPEKKDFEETFHEKRKNEEKKINRRTFLKMGLAA